MTNKNTEVETEVHLWNRTYPVGMPVEVTRDNGEKMLTFTRERAEVAASGHAVVWVDGISGYYLLSRCRPIEEKIEFYEAVHLDPTMTPEMKIYWLNKSCEHLNSLLNDQQAKGFLNPQPERRIVMSVRAKFKVDRIERMLHGCTVGKKEDGTPIYGQKEMQTIVMSPVYANNDPNHENSKFWQYTPTGELKLGTVNAEAAAQFELGKEYYIDFTPAPVG